MNRPIGVLSLQGDFGKHMELLERIGTEAVPVRSTGQLEDVCALIIPGGESTTIGKLMIRFGLDRAISSRIEGGMPVFGTCAGMILLSSGIDGSDQYRIGALDVDVKRNAYGRQVESFEADIPIPSLGAEPVRGVFIRAPMIERIGEGVDVLAYFEDRPVAVRQGNLLAISFHPELAGDPRIHEYFLSFPGIVG